MDRLDETDLRELRVFLESVICDLCRLWHAVEDGVPPAKTRIRQEVRLAPGAYADIHVAAGTSAPYFVEVDYGYSRQRAVDSMRRKYGQHTPDGVGARKVILLVDGSLGPERPEMEAEIRAFLTPGLDLEVWDDRQLLTLIQRTLGLELPDLTADRARELRQAIDRAKASHAFGPEGSVDPLQSALLWHFAYWRLRELRDAGCVDARGILQPGLYAGVVVLMADLCAYSSYVRDTRDDRVIRESLTAFASRTRYRIINDGGMLYQFLGDAAIGFFGIPAPETDAVSRALACAQALIDIGASVAQEWQRQIDQVQPSAGVHISMALGDVQMLSLRPYSRTHMGAVADAINLAARLNAISGQGEIVVSNMLYHALPDRAQAAFTELEPVEAKNMGRVRAWKLGPSGPS